MCPNIGTPSIHHFPFGINGKVVVLGVPILKHLRVVQTKYALMHMSNSIPVNFMKSQGGESVKMTIFNAVLKQSYL